MSFQKHRFQTTNWLKDASVQKFLRGDRAGQTVLEPYLFFFFFFNFRATPQHMEVPWLGVESELQLLANATVTATPDLSRLFDLHHSSRQRQILSPLSESRDQTCILVDASQICFHWAMTGTPLNRVLKSPETLLKILKTGPFQPFYIQTLREREVEGLIQIYMKNRTAGAEGNEGIN